MGGSTVKEGAKLSPMILSVVALLAFVVLMPITIASMSTVAVWIGGGDEDTEFRVTPTNERIQFTNTGNGVNTTCIDGIPQPSNYAAPVCTFNAPSAYYTFNGDHYTFVNGCAWLNGSSPVRTVDHGCGYGPYTYSVPASGFELNNSVISQVSFTLIDFSNPGYNSCNSSLFSNITYDFRVTLEYSNKTYNLADGSKSHFSGLEWGTWCKAIIDFKAEVHAIESLAISDDLEGDWDNATIHFELSNFMDDDARAPAHASMVLLPMEDNWDDSDAINIKILKLSEADTGFAVKGLTWLLSIGMFAIATASTRFWNPLMDRIKGAYYD